MLKYLTLNSPLPRILFYLFAAFYVISFLITVWISMSYPYMIDWIEGGTMDTIVRVMQGKPIYVPATLEYTPFMYTPLYYYLTAPLMFLFGTELWVGRLVTLACTLGIMWLIYAWLRKEDVPKHYAALAVVMFLATNAIINSWFAIVRVDNLFLVLSLAGLYIYMHYKSAFSAVAAGLITILAWYTKQQALLAFIPVFILGMIAYPKRTFIMGATLAAGIAAITYVSQAATDGWFLRYVYEMPMSLPKKYSLLGSYWTERIFGLFGIVTAFCVLGVMVLFGQNWRRGLMYVALLGGMVGTAWGSYINWYAWINVLMPAYVMIIIGAFTVIPTLLRQGTIQPVVFYVLMCAQFIVLMHNPFEEMPSKKHEEATTKLLEYIAELPGDVLIPDMQFIQTKVGKKSFAYRQNAYDIMYSRLSDRGKARKALYDELEEALENKRFSAVIMYENSEVKQKEGKYRVKETILNPRDYPFITVRGAREFPNTVYVPIPRQEPPQDENPSPSPEN